MFLDVSDFARAIFHDFNGVSLPSTVVKQINRGKNGVTVHTSDGKVIEAKAVISTIPLDCLQDMTFNPPLSPLRREAISSGHIDKGAKIYTSVWPQQSQDDSPYAPPRIQLGFSHSAIATEPILQLLRVHGVLASGTTSGTIDT